MINTERLQPLIALLEKNKKISNQEIMTLMNIDDREVQNIRNILIDGENILNDDFTGIRLRNPDKVGFLGKWFGKKTPIITINPQYDVFISYSRKNLDFVNTLLNKIILHQKKYALQPLRIFFDKTEIKLGEDWKSKLMQGLKNATTMLVSVSPEYFDSFYCEWEWQNFISYEVEKKIVRESINWVYIDKSDIVDTEENNNEWHKELKARQFLDLRPLRKPNTKEVNNIYDALLTALYKAELAKQPIQNNIPQLNFRTLARHELYASIDRQLWFTPQNKYSAIILTGENGVGKTTLAYNYAKANTQKYEGGIFVLENANIMADLLDFRPAMLQTLGIEMTIADREDREWMKLTLNNELRQRGHMLWIVDDVQNFEWLKSPERLRNFFPAEAKIHWIFTTTTHPGIVRKMEFMVEHIGDFSEYEAMSYLSTYQPIITDTQKQNCQELLKLIGLKPINVMILGSLLYLQQWNEKTDEIERLLAQNPSVKMVLNDTIAQLPPIEQRILQLAPLMPNDALVIEWLYAFDAWFNESKRGGAKPTFEAWQLATKHLLGLGFLTNTDNESIKSINPTLLKYTDNQTATQLNTIFYEFLSRKAQTNTDYRNLSVFAQYFIKTIPTQTLLKVDVLHNLIIKLGQFSFHNLALDLCNLLLNHFQKLSPYNVGHTHYLKSYILDQNEQYGLALKQIELYINHALKIKSDDLLAVGYGQKSSILNHLKQYTEALKFINSSIEIKEKNNPEKNTDSLAISYNQKSSILQRLEQYTEALKFSNSSIEIEEKNNAEKNTDSLARSYHQKSIILESLEQYTEALKFSNSSIEIKEKNNPEKNTDSLAFSYDQKSRILNSLEQYSEALKFINSSIEIKEKNNPEKNTDSLARSYNQKSSILESLEQHTEALNFINSSIEIKEKNNLEINNDSLASIYYQKSSILGILEQYTEALKFINSSIEIEEKNNPEKNTDSISKSYSVKSGILHKLNRNEEALVFINDAISILKVKFPSAMHLQKFEAIRKLILEKLK